GAAGRRRRANADRRDARPGPCRPHGPHHPPRDTAGRDMSHLRPVLALLFSGNRLVLGAGALLAALSALAAFALLGLSGWFITATAIAGLSAALAFDVFTPSAGIRFLALVRTAARYGERLTTHDATLA